MDEAIHHQAQYVATEVHESKGCKLYYSKALADHGGAPL
jgi:hypothetical protein